MICFCSAVYHFILKRGKIALDDSAAIDWLDNLLFPPCSVSEIGALARPLPPRNPKGGLLAGRRYLVENVSGRWAKASHDHGLLPISTVSPFISPSMVSFNVNRAICTASSSSKSSLYLFSKNVFALVALFPIAVAFHGK